MTEVIIQPCWPYSGKKYEVWHLGKCVLSTDNLEQAYEKRAELHDYAKASKDTFPQLKGERL